MAYRRDKAVGFFMIQSQVCPIPIDGNAIELKQIYVLESEFGTGLGKQLLNEVIKSVHRADKKWIWLSVSDLNLRAQSFYLKHGFKALGAAPTLEVGNDRLAATIMAREV
jgi:ribosomal protein S18 acetylase RimI-like enzyme